MHIHRFRHLPVIEADGRLVGLVSRTDIVRAQISALSGLTSDERRARQDDVTIKHLMTRDLWTVTPETLASHAGQMLLDHAFGCLPVVDAKQTLCGIVTERDFLRIAIKTLEMRD